MRWKKIEKRQHLFLLEESSEFYVKNTIMPFYSYLQVLITTNLVLSQTKHAINIALFSIFMTLNVKIPDGLNCLRVLARSNEVISTKALWKMIKAVYKCKASGISNASPRLNINPTKHDKGHDKPLVHALPPCFFLLSFLKSKCLLIKLPCSIGESSHWF